jgi:hypothetical protein
LLSDEEDIVSSPSTASRELEGVAKQNLSCWSRVLFGGLIQALLLQAQLPQSQCQILLGDTFKL